MGSIPKWAAAKGRPVIIGLSGKKGGGKSTAAKFLTANAARLWPDRWTWHSPGDGDPPVVGTFPMAGPLKRVCVDVLGLLPAQVYGTDEEKNAPTRYRWEDLPHYPRILEDLRQRVWREEGTTECDVTEVYDRVEALRPRGFMTGRQVLQEVGTGVFRRMYARVWPEACVRGILASGADVALVDDVRFPDEVEEIQRAGGVVVRLTRDPSGGADRHESERALDPGVFDWSRFDAVVDNRWTDARGMCRELVSALHSDGRLGTALKLCECCDGLDPLDLDYPA